MGSLGMLMAPFIHQGRRLGFNDARERAWFEAIPVFIGVGLCLYVFAVRKDPSDAQALDL